MGYPHRQNWIGYIPARTGGYLQPGQNINNKSGQDGLPPHRQTRIGYPTPPHQDRMGYFPPPPTWRQNSRASTWYMSVGMSLASKQEDFFLLKTVWRTLQIYWNFPQSRGQGYTPVPSGSACGAYCCFTVIIKTRTIEFSLKFYRNVHWI